MDNNPEANPPAQAAPASGRPIVAVKIFGVGNAGIAVMQRMLSTGLPASCFVAVNSDAQPLPSGFVGEKLQLETKPLRGLGSGGDPELGRAMAEEHATQLQALCTGADAVFIVAGLGGGAGTGISPVLARIAKESGALVMAFVTTPFPCEGNRRCQLAEEGIDALKAVADGVICLPNQKVSALIEENTTVVEAFRIADGLLAEGALGIWRLLTHKGLLDIHFDELCAVIRERHTESAFAVAEAFGATRSREVIEKLMAHPMLEGGILSRSEAVLVSLIGGPDLTMAEVNRVMETLNSKCERAQVIMGAAIDDSFRERLAITLVAATRCDELGQREVSPASPREELTHQLLSRGPGSKTGSRFVPPPPTLPPDQVEQLLARQHSRPRKSLPKLRQTQLPLDIVSKGRFDKSEPTIHKGEDLDVPTYIRRGVALN
jgi:cell division protein FtsZ